MLTSLSGTRDAWPIRLVVISGVLLLAVAVQAVVSIIAAAIGDVSPGSSWVGYAPLGRSLGPVETTVHAQLVTATQWAGPMAGMLLLASAVLVAHIIGTTDAPSDRQLASQMAWLCRAAATLATLTVLAAVIGIVTDVTVPSTPLRPSSVSLQDLGLHVVALLFACVTAWLAIGTLAELRNRARMARGPGGAAAGAADEVGEPAQEHPRPTQPDS